MTHFFLSAIYALNADEVYQSSHAVSAVGSKLVNVDFYSASSQNTMTLSPLMRSHSHVNQLMLMGPISDEYRVIRRGYCLLACRAVWCRSLIATSLGEFSIISDERSSIDRRCE